MCKEQVGLLDQTLSAVFKTFWYNRSLGVLEVCPAACMLFKHWGINKGMSSLMCTLAMSEDTKHVEFC